MTDNGHTYLAEDVSDAGARHHHGTSHSRWIMLGCVVLFVVVVSITIGFWIWAGTTTTTTSQQMHALDAKLQRQRYSDFSSEGLYSLANTLRTRAPHVLQLCHMALYTESEQSKTLHPVDDVAEAAAEHRNDEYYVVKAQFAIQFNVKPEELGYDARRLGLDQLDEHYQMTHYELAANYVDFSTVKLLETELDVHRRALRTSGEFIVCSNNPALHVKRCGTQQDGLFVMNNTRLVLMDAPTLRDAPQKTATTGTTTKALPQGKTPTATPKTSAPTERDDGVDLTPESREHLKGLRGEISHLRLYYLQFYRAIPPVSRDDDTFREQLVLRVEPNKC